MTTIPSPYFKPALDDLGGFEWNGVPVFQTGDDLLIALTVDRGKAAEAMNAYLLLVSGTADYHVSDRTRGLRWALGVFQREPEHAGIPWSLSLTQKPDDMAVQLHYLPL
jgi:hypothetical protein